MGDWYFPLFAYSHFPVPPQKPGVITEQREKALGFHTCRPDQEAHPVSKSLLVGPPWHPSYSSQNVRSSGKAAAHPLGWVRLPYFFSVT